MHRLVFEASDDGRRRFELCHQAVALCPKPTEMNNWEDTVSLLKKLKSIGTPTSQTIGKTVLYDLRDDGGELLLENSEMKLLIDFIKVPNWKPDVLEEVLDTLHWLEKSPKLAASQLKDARPEAKRRAEALVGSIPQALGTTESIDGDETTSATRDS